MNKLEYSERNDRLKKTSADSEQEEGTFHFHCIQTFEITIYVTFYRSGDRIHSGSVERIEIALRGRINKQQISKELINTSYPGKGNEKSSSVDRINNFNSKIQYKNVIEYELPEGV